jgi:hypothetical protein
MSRKTETVTVPRFEGTANRDLGKHFKITEWSAARAEKWGMKMTLAFNRSSGSIPMNLAGIGMEGIAILGINTFLRGTIQAEEIIPLLDELLDCVTMIRDPKFPDVVSPIVSEDDIEEVATRLWLRSEVLRIHVSFSPADLLSALFASIMTKAPEVSSNT